MSKGSVILTLDAAEGSAAAAKTQAPAKSAPPRRLAFAAAPTAAPQPPKSSAARASRDSAPSPKSAAGNADLHAEVVVLGSGPGGYTAAFRAADLGKKVVLVERYPSLGGVCTNVGCIPSKALLHVANVITEAEEMADDGVAFGEPKIDIDKLRAWKDDVVGKGAKGIAGTRQAAQGDGAEGHGQVRIAAHRCW